MILIYLFSIYSSFSANAILDPYGLEPLPNSYTQLPPPAATEEFEIAIDQYLNADNITLLAFNNIPYNNSQLEKNMPSLFEKGQC